MSNLNQPFEDTAWVNVIEMASRLNTLNQKTTEINGKINHNKKNKSISLTKTVSFQKEKDKKKFN